MKFEFTEIFSELFLDVKENLKKELVYKLEAIKKLEVMNAMKHPSNLNMARTAFNMHFLKDLKNKLKHPESPLEELYLKN